MKKILLLLLKILAVLVIIIIVGFSILFFLLIYRGNHPSELSTPNYEHVDAEIFCEDLHMKPLFVYPGEDYFYKLAERLVNDNPQRDDYIVTALDCLETSPFETDKNKVYKLLISKITNVNAKGDEGSTLLFYTDIEDTKLFISKGADVNARNNKGKTPLFYAENEEDAKFLINAGADVNAKDNEGKTALDYATEYKDEDLKALLIKHGAKSGKDLK